MTPAKPVHHPPSIAARIVFASALALFAAWMVTVVLVYAQSAAKLSWGTDYATWPLASGFVISPSHAGRFYRVYANTREAAEVYRYNGERLRYRDGEGTRPFPVGSVLAMETFERTVDNKPGAKGPVFFMRKEAEGYDEQGGNWRYGMMAVDGTTLADGKAGPATECRACHAQARTRDFVFAKDR